MNFKKMALVTFLLLAVLTLGAVSASDDAGNLTATDDGGDDLKVDESLLHGSNTILSDENGTYEDDETLGMTVDMAADDEDSSVLGDPNETEFDDNETEDEFSYDFYVYTAYLNNDNCDYVIEYWFGEGVDGTAAILINGTEIYNATIVSDDNVFLTLDDLDYDFDYGIYEIEFAYSGDENNGGFSVYDNLTVTYIFISELVNKMEFGGIDYSSSAIYRIMLPDDAEGTLVYRINGKEYSVSIDEGYEITIDSEDICYGENNVTFTYVGEDYYSRTIEESLYSLSVVKFPKQINMGETLYITLSLPDDANGDLQIYEVFQSGDDEMGEYVSDFVLLATGEVENGVANVSVSNLNIGSHFIYANFTGDYQIALPGQCDDPEDAVYDVFVKVTPKITIPQNVWIYGGGTAKFEVPSNLTGELKVTIGDEQRTFEFVNGTVIFDLYNLDYVDEGMNPDEDHRLAIFYRCFGLTDSIYINVLMNENFFELINEYSYYQVVVRGQGRYYASFVIPDNADGNVTVYLDNEYYGVAENNWGSVYVSIETDNLTVGKHDVRFEFSGDSYFVPTTAYDSFNVTSVVYEIPSRIIIGKSEGSSSTAYVLMPDDATGEVKLIIDGNEIETKPIDDGRAMFSLSNLTYGNHTVTLIYQNGNYPSSNRTSIVEAKYAYYLKFNELIYGRGDLSLKVPAGATGEVTITIAGKQFRATVDENGTARFNLTGLDAGEYPTTVTYSGDDKYPAETVEFNVTVSYAICADYIYEKIFEGDLAKYSISLILPEDAAGKLVISKEDWSSDDVEYVVLKEIDLVNGRVEITFEELFNGTGDRYGSFDILMEYVGDDYEVDDISSSFYVVGHEIIWPENEWHIILGETVNYTVKFSSNLTGYLRLYDSELIDGSLEYSILYPNINIINGTATFSLDCPQLGRYFYKMEYVGDDYDMEVFFANVVWPENVTLLQEASGDDVLFEVQMPDDASGNLTLFIYSNDVGFEVNATYVGSVATIRASDFSKGRYMLEYFTVSDEKYGCFNFTTTTLYAVYGYYGYFEITGSQELLDPNLSVDVTDIDFGETALINITLNENINGEVLLIVGDSNYTVNVVNGMGKQSISGLNADIYDVKAIFTANEMFRSDESNATFRVNKVDSTLSLTEGVCSYGNQAIVSAISEGATNLSASVVNHTEAIIEINGSSIAVSGLGMGSYILVVTTIADANHNPVTQNTTITVNKPDSSLTVSPISFDYGSSGTAEANFTGADAIIASVVYHPEADVDVNGSLITVSGLDAGTYILSVSTIADADHSPVTVNTTVTVNKIDSALTLVNDIAFDYGSSGSLTFTVENATNVTAVVVNNNKASVKISGNRITVSGLNAGSYVLKVTTITGSNYNAVTQSANVKVNKLKTTVTAPKVSTTYGTSKYIVVTLKDKNKKVLSNKYVVVKLNGKSYKVKTNSKGQAKVKVPATLAVKTYKATITFAGDTNYLKSTGSVSVVVKKATPRFNAKASVSYTVKATKKYTVVLKSNKGKVIKNAKVSLKVKGKTYALKTNSKGQVTFKFTNLSKKGTFAAAIKFAGNKNFKAISKKAKIIVK